MTQKQTNKKQTVRLKETDTSLCNFVENGTSITHFCVKEGDKIHDLLTDETYKIEDVKTKYNTKIRKNLNLDEPYTFEIKSIKELFAANKLNSLMGSYGNYDMYGNYYTCYGKYQTKGLTINELKKANKLYNMLYPKSKKKNDELQDNR